MPNHVTNIVESSAAVISSMLNDEGFPDFNKIIPIPDDLDFDLIDFAPESLAKVFCEANRPEFTLVALSKLNGLTISDDQLETFVQFVKNKRNYGLYHRLDFSRANWGTKWNAYGCQKSNPGDTRAEFQTAWNMPEKIFISLSKMHPEEEIKVTFADEDLGHNCGVVIFKNGEVISEECARLGVKMSDEEREKWCRFAFKVVHPEDDYEEYMAS